MVLGFEKLVSTNLYRGQIGVESATLNLGRFILSSVTDCFLLALPKGRLCFQLCLLPCPFFFSTQYCALAVFLLIIISGF